VKNLAIKYFEYWNNHDLNGLRTIFSSNVGLKDLEIDVSGFEDVLTIVDNQIVSIKAFKV